MKDDKQNPRRKFLKNIGLVSLSAALLPETLMAGTAEGEGTKETAACDPTTLDYYGEGPFYTANPPTIQNGLLTPSTTTGDRLIITGRVMNLDCTQAIANAEIDIWQADDAGAYDNQGYHLRGKTYSNAQGFYSFETVKPGKYLNGSQYRPSHIHFKISASGFNTLTTQLYFAGDTSIANDAAASISSGQYDASARIIAIQQNTSGVYEGTWDIVINAIGNPLGIVDLHIDKGIIYSAYPTIFNDELNINYGVFNDSKVSIKVYDQKGAELAVLVDDQKMTPEKYTLTWKPKVNLPAGTYFVTLQINDMQVHYLKVQKTNN